MEALSAFFNCPPIYVDENDAARVFPELFDAGLFELLECIVSDGDLFEDCTEWTEYVLDILEYLSIVSSGTQHWNGTEWADNDPDDSEDDEVMWIPPDLNDFRHRLANLFALTFQDAWARRDLFVVGCRNDLYHVEDWVPSSGDIRSGIRRLLFLSPYLRTPPFMQNPNATQAFRKLCLLLWMSPDSDFDGADTLFAVVTSSFDVEPEKQQAAFANFVVEDMVAVYGALPILERICQALKRPEEGLGSGLHCTLFVGAAQVLTCNDFWPYLSQTKVFPALDYAIDYHLQKYPQKDTKLEFNMVFSTVKLAHILTRNAPFQSGAGFLIRETNIVSLLARFIVFSLNEAKVSEPKPFMDAIGEWIKIASALSLRSGKNEIRKKFKQSLRHEWYPTLKRLRTTACSEQARREQVLDVWTALGTAIGLEEGKAKAEYEREMKHAAQFCAWKDCRFHTVKPDTPTRACAGCDEVRYCGKPCQQRDWKEGGHKLRCRRIKAG
ncbi:hypothetical protein PENSPDRAFT_455091 [Peniophora sp. CONT]|nr:hypothetical protein PENSPDRAFT_455091 [Peniophora sp. CONT]